MTELKASLCYGNDSPGVTGSTPKPFEAVYPPTDLSEVVASLRREVSSMDKLAEEQAAEIAALREENERQATEIKAMATALENEVRWRREREEGR